MKYFTIIIAAIALTLATTATSKAALETSDITSVIFTFADDRGSLANYGSSAATELLAAVTITAADNGNGGVDFTLAYSDNDTWRIDLGGFATKNQNGTMFGAATELFTGISNIGYNDPSGNWVSLYSGTTDFTGKYDFEFSFDNKPFFTEFSWTMIYAEDVSWEDVVATLENGDAEICFFSHFQSVGIIGGESAKLNVKDFDIIYNISPNNGDVTTTPEPATMAIFGLGIIGLGAARRFHNKK